MKFNYKGRTKEGKVETGIIEAYSKEAAALLLQKYSIYVTYLEEQGAAGPLLKKVIFEKKPSKKDLTVFFRQLAVMLASQVPVVQSLTSLGNQATNASFKKTILAVAGLVEEGLPLSDAFATYPNVFDNFYVNLVKSGEASGNIAGALEYISGHLEREGDIVAQLKQAMVYPLFVVAVLFVVLTVIMFKVVPRIIDLINESNTKPPLFTKIMLGFYGFIEVYWWAVLIAFVLFIIALIFYLRTESGKENLNKIILKIPLIGDLLKKIFLARFCGNVSTLVQAGISINKALRITQGTVNSNVYKQIIGEIEQGVSEGEKMSSVMAKHEDYFPPFVLQMIRVGEETGKLDKTLLEIVAFYQKEIVRTIDFLTSLIEPVMIIVLGIIVALLAVSVLGPLYSALGNI